MAGRGCHMVCRRTCIALLRYGAPEIPICGPFGSSPVRCCTLRGLRCARARLRPAVRRHVRHQCRLGWAERRRREKDQNYVFTSSVVQKGASKSMLFAIHGTARQTI
eukprot:6183346-Pleurochrysis_carterae.AAC.1